MTPDSSNQSTLIPDDPKVSPPGLIDLHLGKSSHDAGHILRTEGVTASHASQLLDPCADGLPDGRLGPQSSKTPGNVGKLPGSDQRSLAGYS